MNTHIYQAIGKDFDLFKKDVRDLSAEFGEQQGRYFNDVLELVEGQATDKDLETSAQRFFVRTASEYAARFEATYDLFYKKLDETKLGMSGLVFRHYWSSVHNKAIKRM